MYHSVAEVHEATWIDPDNHVAAELFERQMQFLASHRRVISLSELAQAIETESTCPANTVVITFDDGYLDNLNVAAPLLARYGLPATLFLPTGYIDRVETQWIDRLYRAFTRRSADLLTLPDLQKHPWDLRHAADQKHACRVIRSILLTAHYRDRQRLLEQIDTQLKPQGASPRLTMSWDDVRSLVRDFPLMSLGAHTVDHIDLTQLNVAEAAAQLTDSQRRICSVSGEECPDVSFPYGRTCAEISSAAAQNGFRTACGGCDDPLILGSHSAFSLPRVAAPQSMARFEFVTSSMNTGFWQRVMR